MSKEAHYYSHHNVGGYDSIGFLNEFGGLEAPEVLEASALICYHMEPYFWKNDKTKEKYKLLCDLRSDIDDRLINDLSVALDIAVDNGPVDKRYEQLKSALATLCKYEVHRLR